MCRRAMSSRYEPLLPNYPPERGSRADFVRWKLLINAAQGKDRAVQSLKLLGSDKRCAMWQPDSALGVIIVGEMPRELESVLRSHGENWPDEPEQVNGNLP